MKTVKNITPAPGVLVFLSHLGIQGQRGNESITQVPTDRSSWGLGWRAGGWGSWKRKEMLEKNAP